MVHVRTVISVVAAVFASMGIVARIVLGDLSDVIGVLVVLLMSRLLVVFLVIVMFHRLLVHSNPLQTYFLSTRCRGRQTPGFVALVSLSLGAVVVPFACP